MKVIGVSGIARSGKDLFTTVAQDILEKEYKLKTGRRALAYELRSDLKDTYRDWETDSLSSGERTGKSLSRWF